VHNIPGGWVEVDLPHDWKPAQLSIEVRRVSDGRTLITDALRGAEARQTVRLQMDLPDTQWIPGLYKARLIVEQGTGESPVGGSRRTTDWFDAFELRGAIWFG
jgi:hypothetical protein